jgi:hypothetical protein
MYPPGSLMMMRWLAIDVKCSRGVFTLGRWVTTERSLFLMLLNFVPSNPSYWTVSEFHSNRQSEIAILKALLCFVCKLYL